MNQQSQLHTDPQTPQHGLIPLIATFERRSAAYSLRSVRSTLPVTDLGAFPQRRTAVSRTLGVFSAIYSRLGIVGPFVVRMLTLILHRILKQSIIPAELVALARYPVLFDRTYYLQQLRDAQQPIPSDALYHYLTSGDAHNLCPNPLFDPSVYRRYNMLPDEATQNTLMHYIHGVWHGNGVTSYVFHSRWYMEQNADVAATGINPLAHYLTVGFREHRDPSAVMQLGNYWARTPQLAKTEDPAQHYMTGGFRRYPHTDEMLNLLTDMPFGLDVSREFQHFATHAGLPQSAAQRAIQHASIKNLLARCAAVNPLEPRVSIIIPVYNQLTYTINAIESILLSDTRTPFEILVIDDLSTDETAQFFADLAPIRIHTQATNQGFIAACNQGAALARGEFLLFLNNDVYVLPQWLDALFDTFGQIPNVGLVGSQFLYPDGLIQEAGGIVWQNGEGWNYGRGEYPMIPTYAYARSVDYCSGASIMIRASLFTAVGMFPDAFKPAYYEDTDLGMAVRAAGYDVIYQPASKIVHFEGVSSGRDVRSGVKSYQVRNQQLFAEKWRDQLGNRRPYGDNPHLAAVYWYGDHMFFADASYPTPDQDAGSQVADSWMRIFRRLGYHVTFLPVDNFIGVPKYTKRLEALGVYCPRRPYEEHLQGFFAHPVHPFAFGVFHRYDRARRVYDILDTLAIDLPRMFIPADLHHLRDLRQAVLTGSMTDILGSFKTKYEEYAVMAQSTLICVHSNHERDEINTTIPQLDVEVSPIMYDVPGRTRGYHERADVLFVGGFRHPPNIDGIVFFCTEVWPLVQKKLPGIVLKIVGSNTTPAVESLACPTVDVMGFVEHLDPILDGIRLTIAPLRYGAGVKGKVTMSMCNGIPVVGTAIAFEGMSLTNGVEMLAADDAQLMADHIVAAYGDEQLWYRLSDAAVARAQAEYSAEANIPLFERFIAKTARPHGSGIGVTAP
jgi:GT2 family glycosyltransferase